MSDPLLTIEGLRLEATNGPQPRPILHGVSFEVGRERVALVGESGSGKSLTARAILGLLPPGIRRGAGRIMLGGTDLASLGGRGWMAVRGKSIGIVPQDPRFSLNPVHKVGRQVEEALLLHTALSRAQRRARALDMLARVGLGDPLRVYGSTPAELSGGMGQRVMIAAMLIAEPRLLIADEPTSALDQDVRGQILDLLRDLAEERGMGLLFISHDLQEVAGFAHRALVMRRGLIVDRLPAGQLPQATHPYTRALWHARPSGATHGTRLPTGDWPAGGARS